MSAKMEKFFELQRVVDHDCGNYRIGEIDFVRYEDLILYIKRHGEFGYQELMNAIMRMSHAAYDGITEVRRQMPDESCKSAPTIDNINLE